MKKTKMVAQYKVLFWKFNRYHNRLVLIAGESLLSNECGLNRYRTKRVALERPQEQNTDFADLQRIRIALRLRNQYRFAVAVQRQCGRFFRLECIENVQQQIRRIRFRLRLELQELRVIRADQHHYTAVGFDTDRYWSLFADGD